MSYSINRNITPVGLLKFAAPSIIMMIFMFLAIVGTISWIFIGDDLWNRLKGIR